MLLRRNLQYRTRGRSLHSLSFLRKLRKTIRRLKRRGKVGGRPNNFRHKSRRCPTRNSICNMSAWAVPAPLPATPTATLPISASVFHKTFRSQESPDIEPADLLETPLVQSYADLLAAAQVQNPEIASAQKMIERQSLQVDLARKDFYPDFNVEYMWQRTDPAQFRAYYMLSVGIKVPIYRSRKQRPELAQAESEQLRARSELQARSQQLAGDLRSQYVIVQQTSELLKIHRQ